MRNGKRQRCYIGITNRHRVTIRGLLQRGNVVRVTDHGSHVKIVTRGALKPFPGLSVVPVRDQTTHWDVTYWDFAMAVVRHANRRKQTPSRAIGVLVHYLANLWVLPEAKLLTMLAAQNEYTQHSTTDEEAHGWELTHLARLRRKGRHAQR